IIAAEIHLVRRFKPGFWASLEANYYTGGRQTIAGEKLVDLQRNSRFGGTVVVPFKGRHAVKLGYSAGVTTDFGTDFNQFLVSYQMLF
ncbi:MAG: transporter, partial [bacterium]|nr:transporter [bacterium]